MGLCGVIGGGPKCHMSNFKKYQLSDVIFVLYFHFDIKIALCRMSNLRNSICHVIDIFPAVDRPHILHVGFKKLPCRCVEFMGEKPFILKPALQVTLIPFTMTLVQ